MNKVMKKWMYIFVLLLGGFTMAPDAQAASKAMFKGVGATTVTLGATFNPKLKVSVVDAKGKKLTKKLNVTGTVNSNKKGTYYITYKVNVSAKQTLTAKRKITVKAKSYKLKAVTRQFDAKSGMGRHNQLKAGTKLSLIQKATGGWYKTSTSYWIKDGFLGDYVYIAPKQKLFPTATTKVSKKNAPTGIAKVMSTATKKSRVKISSGWIEKPQFVDDYATKGITAQQKELLKLVNSEREKVGVKPLVLDQTLSKLAIIRSSDMISQTYFEHSSPSYGSFSNLVHQINYSYWMLGENIAAGGTSAQQYMKMWMNSEGHRNNILNANYTRIGIGVVKNIKTGFYSSVATQIFAKK
ncbi:MAG: DUF5011 domain-containing protein [Kurthia sp.]|nr:DUF5011 domain-containing protein [Candidatus Kurthia equi]